LFHGGEVGPDILEFRDGKWLSVTHQLAEGQPAGYANFLNGGSDLMVAPDGALWATGYNPNLLAFDGANWTEHTAQPPGTSEPDWFHTATIDARGVIWASGGNGLLRFDGDTAVSVPTSREARWIRSLAVDNNSGVLWAGTWEGLAAYDGRAWNSYRTAGSLPSNIIGSLAAAGGDLWVGTASGLSRHNAAGWETMDPTVAGEDGEIALAIDPDGAVWVGAGDTISRFDGTSWHTESDSGYYPPLALDATGAVWAIEYRDPPPRGDLARLEEGTWTEYPIPDACRGVYAMAVDGDGTLWTLGGCSTLCSYDSVSWTVHYVGACWDPVWDREPDVAYPGNVLALAIDPAGQPVVSTNQAGLLRWDGTRWVALDDTAGDLVAATTMAFGPDGSLWVLESEGSPHRAAELQYDPSHRYVLWQRTARGNWRSIPSPHLTNVWPSVLVVDDAGAVWIGTQAGLLRYVPSAEASGD
jgi:streptogramin lyase